MVHCARHERARRFAEAEESFVWYPKHGAQIIGDARRLDGGAASRISAPTTTPATRAEVDESGSLDHLTFDYSSDTGAAIVGDPDRCIEIAKRYEAAGCELLFCLLNPYKIPHDQVMRSIELLGKHVIPEFDRG